MLVFSVRYRRLTDGLMSRNSPEASNLFTSYRDKLETENSPCFCDVLFLFIEYDDLKAVNLFLFLHFLSRIHL